MSVVGTNLLASFYQSLEKDKSWPSIIHMETNQFSVETKSDGKSCLTPNYDLEGRCEVNIMDFFKKDNRIVLDAHRSMLGYPDDALFMLNFEENVSEEEVVHHIKVKAKLNGSSLLHYRRNQR